MTQMHLHEPGRQRIQAVIVAARRYVLASEAHATRDWDTFEAENLAAVSVEYDHLKEAVEALGELPWSTP